MSKQESGKEQEEEQSELKSWLFMIAFSVGLFAIWLGHLVFMTGR